MLPPAAAAIASDSVLLRELLAVSLTGVIFYTPIHDPAGSGEIIDFTFEYLNPVAQRMMRMPEVPTLTHMGQWPHSKEHGTFQFHVEAFESGEPREYNINYQADGYDNYYRLAARRAGAGLLVSFTDTADQPRSPVEVALREAQAAEKAARADAETQRQRLYQILLSLPAQVATYHGPEHIYTLVNQRYQDYFPTHTLLGRAVQEAVPEAASQGFFDRLDQVYATGQPAYGQELPVCLDFSGNGQPAELIYINAFYLPLRDAAGQVDGVLDFSYNVTEQVLARQQVEQLNQELEGRVQARTQEGLALQAEVLAATARQVRERETFYQVFAQTPACIALLRGPEHRFEYVNAAYQQLFPGRELVGWPLREALPETEPQGFLALMNSVYQTGETFFGTELLLSVEPADGQPAQEIYFTFTYQAYRENGAVAGISIFAYDVTEQVLARQEREAQRQELEQLFMQAPAPIVILDGPELVFQLVNPAYQRIFPGRALAGKPLMDALPELAGTPIPDLFQRVYQTGEPITVHELPLLMARHEGHAPEDIYWTFTYQARRDGHGRIDGVRVFAHDVTEQVRTRQAAEANAHRLRLLTDALPVLISYIDRDQTYRFANRAYEDWFGFAPADVVGRHPREVAGAVAYEQVRPYVERALAGERVEYEAAMAYRPDAIRHVRTTFIPDVQAEQVAGIYTLVSDITPQVEARQQVDGLNQELAAINEELRATNDELLESNTQLTRTNVDLDNFIYTASHDLKVPIANIEGLLQALARELPPAALVDDVPEMLRLMQQAIERFGRTIEQLTDVSKLQQAHAQPATPVELAAVVEEVRLDLLPLVQQTGAQLAIVVPPTARLPFSQKNLRSVVYNLLSNALKYRHPERLPRVQLTYEQQGAYHVLRVQDNGLGFDVAQTVGKLFGMFQRLHTHVEGSGIGLYMVRKMVENSGGRIEVQSQPGEGSSFTVFIPVHPGS